MKCSNHKFLNGKTVATFAATLALSAALGLSFAPMSSAQNRQVQPQTNRGQQPAAPANRRTQQPAEYQASDLDREIQLPNVPSYTGKQKYVSGLIYPNAKQGPGYYMIYNTEHTESQVKEWWQNALSMDPWKVNFTDATTVKARAKDGSTCNIVVMGVQGVNKDTAKGMRGSYSLFCHIVQK